MTNTHRRSRYQAGCLTIESRSNGADVYIFRWRASSADGQTMQRKVVLGTIKELTKTQAHKRADTYREKANTPQPAGIKTAMSVAELTEHFRHRELSENCGKTTKVIKAYKQILDSYTLPKWGERFLSAVKAIAVEDWLRSLD